MQHIQTSSFSSKLNHMLMLLVFQSIPQPLWLIESNLMQASLLTPLSWILLLGHERKEQTWSSFLWAWRSEWCLFSVAVSTERLCHWRFKFSFAIHRLLRRLSIPYTRLPLEKYVFPRTRTENSRMILTVPIFICFSILMCLVIFAISRLFSCL